MNWGEWPGKSTTNDGGCEHPAAYHMLDVAAVAERLTAHFDYPPALRDALVLLVGLHDIGKISTSFRSMLRDGTGQGWRHWELSEVLFYLHDERLSARIGGVPRMRQALYASVAGHHGQPSSRALGSLPLRGGNRQVFIARRQIGEGEGPAGDLIDAFCDMWPRASLADLEPESESLTALTWWLPGLCAAADWIGSNTRWFEPRPFGPSLAEYLADARKRAEVAVGEAGLEGARVLDGSIFDFDLRPMQQACSDIALPGERPVLAIIEEETGAGKTEAALILAQRMIAAGKGRGFFFALPTMATADAMFARAARAVGRMLHAPSLTLAHGRSGLSEGFRRLVTDTRSGNREEDEPNCADWLAESRRRALLADVGVGTIDQALLAVLPVRHQALRHFALSSKILIVDEVHEMGEPYIAKELVELLRMHRAAGGSAILLTATLPLDLRAKLLSTYEGASESTAYPALTIAAGDAITAFPADPRPTRGAVQVERLDAAQDAVRLIVENASRGAACVWIRNAVDDAITAVSALRETGIEAHLLHARYALGDRKRIEADVLDRAGRQGRAREGFVLVGTQVLEASLDLDFDVMVSDIAPVAALIQRAGRLWRHTEERPAVSRPVPAPVLHVLSPDPGHVDDPRWLHGTLDSGAWVYPVSTVWRSARVLFSTGLIDAPAGLRALIEAVHGDAAEPVPAPLQQAELEIEGRNLAAQTQAVHNIINWAEGYRMGGRGNDDARYPTRLGDEQVVLVLARRGADGLEPWFDAGDDEAWMLSEVSVASRRVARLELPDQAAPDIRAVKKDWPTWKRASHILCPVEEGGAICEGLKYGSEHGLVFSVR
ncbi:MAG: CRISPR-associated helicase Cas3' [Brevundimonas sp.]|uniref:CRISPR-associated helicase Cas3' n=1 Tax=Brevundimonas sp. TaxID=1871086 RepID=UPI00391D638F